MALSAFHGAHDFVLNDLQLIHQVFDGSRRAGLEELREASIPGVSHDSSERYPPPRCHPRTREGYIERLTNWGLHSGSQVECMTWLKGPAGVGKSAIAQSCAEALGEKLGASIFFSQLNHRDDPDRFFTSIAYQLAEKFNSYGNFLDDVIRRRPSIVKKALPQQFHDLFIIPFTNSTVKEGVGERVIIVDGLDECARVEAQVDIIQIVADSIRARTTPFRWIFLSRLEPKIVMTFDLPDIKSVSQQINLPISRQIDGEIMLYLTEKLREIGREHRIASPWPSEEEVWVLVDFSAGLFACAYAVVHFIGAQTPTGPVEQLHAVLQLAKRSPTTGGNNPLSALDELYTLVMKRVPPAMLQTVQWILLTTRVPLVSYASDSANLSGLSELQLRNACRCLHPVAELKEYGKPRIAFYHASFIEFLEDPARSGRFYLWSDCATTLFERVLHNLDQLRVFIDNKGRYSPRLRLTWPNGGGTQWFCYVFHLKAIFKILYSIRMGDDIEGFRSFLDFDFRKFSFNRYKVAHYLTTGELESLMRNLDSRLKLLRPCILRNWRESFLNSTSRYYIIGRGKKRVSMEIMTCQDAIGRYDVLLGSDSPRNFKKWAEQLYKESKQSKSTSLSN